MIFSGSHSLSTVCGSKNSYYNSGCTREEGGIRDEDTYVTAVGVKLRENDS